MSDLSDRKERLHRLIDFARAYRGWNRIQTARALGRDSSKLYPSTGNPKLDMLVGLADVLEWTVDDVVEYIWQAEGRLGRPLNGETFETLDRQAGEAHRAGEYQRMAEIAQRMYAVARTPEQRARACNREHGGWDGRGRYTKALEAACRGLRESPIPIDRRHQLQINLANTHYALWELASALAHANVIVDWYEKNSPSEPIQRRQQAFAYYVRGNTLRRLAAQQHDACEHYAATAKKDLGKCIRLYTAIVKDLDDPQREGIANTCRGAIIELDVELGLREPVDAVEHFLGALDQVVDPTEMPVGDWLESYGWWCVFGANVALRHLTGRSLQQAMAVFTNKSLEIAERMDNWALRERAFSTQYALHEKLIQTTGLDLPYVVDEEEQRLITGAMGRFPSFRGTGWRILRAANVVAPALRN